MAKFNIEVESDWIDEETGCTIDEEIKEQVVSGVKDDFLEKQQMKQYREWIRLLQIRFSKQKERFKIL